MVELTSPGAFVGHSRRAPSAGRELSCYPAGVLAAFLRSFVLLVSLVMVASALGCTQQDTSGRPETGLEALTLTSVDPGLVVPGTLVVVKGNSFLAEPLGISHLRLTGDFDGRVLDVELPAKFIDFDELHVEMTPQTLAAFGANDGDFTGNAQVIVDFAPDGSRHGSLPLPLSMQIRSTLTPGLADLQVSGEVYVNDPIAIEGDGFLLGDTEGTTFAVVEGCFTPQGGTECEAVGPVEVPIVPDGAGFDRTRATFPFSPRIAGISPGTFEGVVSLRNVLTSGAEGKSDGVPVGYDLVPTEIFMASTSSGTGASLGQFIDIEGGGFIGGDDDGYTVLRFVGDYTLDATATSVPVDLELFPEFVDGTLVRYLINEDDALGTAIDVRVQTGAFEGTITPSVSYGDDALEGTATPFTFQIRPVRQIIWVRFQPSYVESLRGFGLRAMDQEIRDRILAVLARDYETIGIEFRTEEPTDYKLYGTIDLSGPDPNGLGLLGYDNSPGKDINNDRLFDKIGGVNAKTQEDGFPGFGGVFIDSLFAFSHHPPTGSASEAAADLFDDVFDPLRPDTGEPINSADFALGAIPVLTSGDTCPADDRRDQIACAVWVMGSLIGTTTSHEVGHSLGLADPLGTRFHDLGDAADRLMDAGGARTFEERAELMGQGPAMFCDDEYLYLREILPTTDPDTPVVRPFC
jgi:hypothetical protein